jgi:N-acetylmuramoyl-L-alanine amidase
VIGSGIALAVGTLEGKGLVVEVDHVLSDAASDTVLSSLPAAGAAVRTGDTVRLQVASPRSDEARLRPFRLDGVVIVIDPGTPGGAIASDPALEVGRRLRSLIEASGGTARLTRSGSDTSTADVDRVRVAHETTYTAGVGLRVATSGQEGMVVSVLTSLTAPLGVPGAPMASAIASNLAATVGAVREEGVPTDPVFGQDVAPWANVTLGLTSSREDVSSFIDPRWADQVARAIYQALGQVFGLPEGS